MYKSNVFAACCRGVCVKSGKSPLDSTTNTISGKRYVNFYKKYIAN